jgi:hypothetical protein
MLRREALMLAFESPILNEMDAQQRKLFSSKESVAHRDRERILFIEREIKDEWSWFQLLRPRTV